MATLAAVLLLVRSGVVPLMDPDEARFARTSVEMLRSGDLVVPTFEGAPRLVKPPLLHWIQATLFRWLGVSEFAVRLPAIVATLGSLLLLAFVARRRFGEEGAAWAAAIFATMPLVVVEGKVGTLDALLSVHVLGAVALDMAEPREAGRYRGAAMGALMGLAFLAKGPVGVILPLLLMLAGRTASGRPVLPSLGAVTSAAAAWSVVVLPWGLVFLERVGASGTLHTIRREVLERYFAESEHVEPPWFYAKVAFVGFLPWIAPLLLGLVRLLGRRRDPASSTALYASAALLAGLLFFSLGRGKLPNYILPLAPLASIVITWEFGRELSAPRERTLGSKLLIMTLAILGGLLWWASSMLPEADMRWVAIVGATAYTVGALVALLGMGLQSVRWVYGVTATAAFLFLMSASIWLFPAVSLRRSAEPLIREVPELHSSRPLVLVDMRVPSLTFYLDRVPERIEVGQIAERLGRGDSPLLVLDEADLPRIEPSVLARLRPVGQSGKYRVYEPPAPGPTESEHAAKPP